MACLGPIGAVFSKDRRMKMGGVKQEWQKVRRLLVGATLTSKRHLDDKDDFGEDFVREMLKADAIEDAAMLCCTVKPAEKLDVSLQQDGMPTGPEATPSRIASIFNTHLVSSSQKTGCLKTGSGPKKETKLDKSVQKQATHIANVFTALEKDADMEEATDAFDSSTQAAKFVKKNDQKTHKKTSKVTSTDSCQSAAKTSQHAQKQRFVLNICKPDRQKLRQYLKKGHVDDAVFDKLARRWHNYNASKRLINLQTLQLPPCIFRCCGADTQSCLCDKAAAARFFAKVCGKTILQCAMLFVSQQRNHEYTQSLPTATHKK